MVDALLKNDKSLLNKGNIGYIKIYYDILDNLFKLDTNLRRDENPEKEEDVPKTSIFGAEAKLESHKDLKDKTLKWAVELLKHNEAVHLHLRSSFGEDVTKDA